MKQKQGFTLIELLVVVLIIGILAAVAVPQYQRAVDKARYTQAITLVENIIRAQQRYQLANGNITTHFDELDVDMPTPTGTANNGSQYNYSWGYCWLHDTGYTACKVNLGTWSRAIVYAGYYHSERRQCWAYTKDNARANAFCQYITKKRTGHDNGAWMEYNF